MKKTLLIALMCLPILVIAQTSTVTKVPINTKNGNPRGYVEYLPENYDNSGVTKYPILYWLHGLGKAGDGSDVALNVIYNNQICQWLKSHDVDFIVLAPQDYNGYFSGPYPSRLTQFVEWANQEYGGVIDFSQQHLAGLSSGGYGIREFIIENSDAYKSFATFTPMSTNFNNANTPAHVQKIVDNDQYVWMHHGTADTSPNAIGAAMNFHNSLYNLDNTRARLTAYVGLGHSAWEEVYDASGQNKQQLIGTINGTTYYNWTNSDPDGDWFGWMLSHGRESITPVAPSTINLSNNTIEENNSAGSFVGLFSTDGSSPLSYSLITGSGDTDNASFNISGDSLYINASTDYETKSSYSLRVECSNAEGSTQSSFTVLITDVNEEPVTSGEQIIAKVNFGRFNSVAVSGWNNIFENVPTTSMPPVSLLDETGVSTPWQLSVTDDFLSTPNNIGPVTGDDTGRYPDDVLAYAWFDRYGGSISISGLDDSLTYKIQAYGNTSSSESMMQVYVNSTQVGGTVDVQGNATGADYEFEAVEVSPISGSITITISGDNSSVRNYGHLAALVLTQESNSGPTAPSTINLSNNTIEENNSAGSFVGLFSTDGSSPLSYSLITGSGDTDNASFNISGDSLYINASTDYETKSSYSLRVECSNAEGSTQSSFTVLITDVNEEPVTSGEQIIAKVNFGRFNSVAVSGWNNIFENVPTTSMPPVSFIRRNQELVHHGSFL